MKAFASESSSAAEQLKCRPGSWLISTMLWLPAHSSQIVFAELLREKNISLALISKVHPHLLVDATKPFCD